MPTPDDNGEYNVPPARVICELQTDGTLTIEYYKNGSRSRVPVIAGDERHAVMSLLRELQASLNADAERKRASAKAKAEDLHRRVYWNVSRDHGEGFAQRVIGPRPSGAPVHGAIPAKEARKLGFAIAAEYARQDSESKAKTAGKQEPSAKRTISLAAALDLI